MTKKGARGHEFLYQDDDSTTFPLAPSRATRFLLAISDGLRYVTKTQVVKGYKHRAGSMMGKVIQNPSEGIIEITDEERIFKVINDGAARYKGVIPDDCWHEPYMAIDELRREMKRMQFWGYISEGELLGVIGKEPVKDTTLIRHLYVLAKAQRKGIGSKLLKHVLKTVSTEHLMIGTWQAASWAIAFYKKHGFELSNDKDYLLRRYWDIPERQIETSCVLCEKLHEHE